MCERTASIFGKVPQIRLFSYVTGLLLFKSLHETDPGDSLSHDDDSSERIPDSYASGDEIILLYQNKSTAAL